MQIMPTTKSGKSTGPPSPAISAPQAPTTPASNRDQRKAMIKKDVTHVLEELWGYGPDEIFYKIFERQTRNGGV